MLKPIVNKKLFYELKTHIQKTDESHHFYRFSTMINLIYDLHRPNNDTYLKRK